MTRLRGLRRSRATNAVRGSGRACGNRSSCRRSRRISPIRSPRRSGRPISMRSGRRSRAFRADSAARFSCGSSERYVVPRARPALGVSHSAVESLLFRARSNFARSLQTAHARGRAPIALRDGCAGCSPVRTRAVFPRPSWLALPRPLTWASTVSSAADCRSRAPSVPTGAASAASAARDVAVTRSGPDAHAVVPASARLRLRHGRAAPRCPSVRGAGRRTAVAAPSGSAATAAARTRTRERNGQRRRQQQPTARGRRPRRHRRPRRSGQLRRARAVAAEPASRRGGPLRIRIDPGASNTGSGYGRSATGPGR